MNKSREKLNTGGGYYKISPLREEQERSFGELIDYVFSQENGYRKILKARGLNREDISGLCDITKLPFTDKSDLAASYPFGLQAAPDRDIVRINATSGTSGKMALIPLTAGDVSLFEEGLCRALRAQGVTEESRIQNTFSYSMFIGGAGIQSAAEKLGAAVIPTSVGNTRRQIDFIRELGTTHLAATPSYALRILEEAKRTGVLDGFKLSAIFVAGEPCSVQIRERIEALSGATVYDVYGNAEMTNVFYSCKFNTGMHVPEDIVYIEIIDAEGNPLPEGSAGELVITTLKKRGMPLIRYNTHDIAVLVGGECPCGDCSLRVKILGRADSLIILKGCKFYPWDIDRALSELAFLNGKYEIVREKSDTGTAITLILEKKGSCEEEADECERLTRQRLKECLGVTPEFKIVDEGSLTPSTGDKSGH